MSDKQPDTRSHEHIVEIEASRADVWRAITAAEELVRWFPLAAETEPGTGGHITYEWGGFAGTCKILEWRPPEHLRTTWMEAPASPDAPAASVCVDWFLEGSGGKTVLRVVHSGFGRDQRWDKEYDGTKRGWTFELQGLKHYLERQRGKQRRAAWVRQVVACAPDEVWKRFSTPGAIFREVALDSLGAGDRYRLVRGDGEVLAGRVLVNRAPLEFAATLESHGDGMLRFGFEDCTGAPEAHVWIATWGLSEQEFAGIEARWRGALERVFKS